MSCARHSITIVLLLAVVPACDSQALRPGDDDDSATAPPTGTWVAAPDLGASRDALVVLVDAGGAVWAFGGRDQDYVPQRTVERWGPGEEDWTPVDDLIERRSFQLVFTLESGEVLQVGGYGNGGSLDNAERYGGEAVTLDLQQRRELLAGVALADGRILVAGGYNGNLDMAQQSAEIYRPQQDLFEAVGSMSERRFGHTATTLPDGSVLVCGGWTTSSDTSLASCERFDPDTETFTAAVPMTTDRTRHTATVLPDGRVLVTGGYSQSAEVQLDTAEIYDPTADAWTPMTSRMSDPRMDHTATSLPDGAVLVVGGFRGLPEPTTVASVDLFVPGEDRFYPMPPIDGDRHEHAATAMPDGSVLVVGGLSWPADTKTTTCLRFVPGEP